MKLLTVIGARPQFIKAALVSRAISQYSNRQKGTEIEEVLVHTGQHFDSNMSDIFFAELDLPPPAYHLGVGALHHNAMTGRMLERLDSVIERERPDGVLVYGDTNSTLAGALAAAKRRIPVAHVEAGVRSFRRDMPEEINRVLTDRISRWLFCPTQVAVENLEREGIANSGDVRVIHVGDVMYDAWLLYCDRVKATEGIARLIAELRSQYYLATVHREENTDGVGRRRLFEIISALDEIAQDVPVVLPVHPRTRQALHAVEVKAIRMIEPVGYLDMMALLKGCKGVITDSGGLQKEAYFSGKPCLTLRDETEWVELVQEGASVLVGADPQKIKDTERMLRTGDLRIGEAQLYGDGQAATRIIEVLAGAK